MRPDALESIQALRIGLSEVLGPELQSAYAEDTSSVLQMFLESIAAEWDTAADDLDRDNKTLTQLLADARKALAGNGNSVSAVDLIDEALDEPDAGSLAISELSARSRRLREALETALIEIEDRVGDDRSLQGVRAAAYAHLREVAGRGWCFWDVASFREYMVRYRTERSQMTA